MLMVHARSHPHARALVCLQLDATRNAVLGQLAHWAWHEEGPPPGGWPGAGAGRVVRRGAAGPGRPGGPGCALGERVHATGHVAQHMLAHMALGPAKRATCAPLQAPALAVLALGLYLLVRLAHGVLTFSSYPEETAALQKVRPPRPLAAHAVARSVQRPPACMPPHQQWYQQPSATPPAATITHLPTPRSWRTQGRSWLRPGYGSRATAEAAISL